MTQSALRLPDERALTEQTVVFKIGDGSSLRVDVLTERLFRVRQTAGSRWTESGMNRYGILTETFPAVSYESDGAGRIKTACACLTVDLSDGKVSLEDASGNVVEKMSASPRHEGMCKLSFSLVDDELIYGLGDSNRENIMRRGEAYEIWVMNVVSYIPVPMALSSKGWGMLLNSTWHNFFDVGKSDPSVMTCEAPYSELDYYLFTGEGLGGLLDVYTQLTGRPAVLPIWAYSLAYVCHQDVDAFGMMNECMEMHRNDIPCDILGLEPGWMATRYDYTTKKKWNDKKFHIPKWMNNGGPGTFLGALDRQGYKLSLWQCCDYDLSFFEEQQVADHAGKPFVEEVEHSADHDTAERDRKMILGYRPQHEDAVEQDEHLDGFRKKEEAEAMGGTVEEAPEPWYEHWKHFVVQGARAFKLDGANQVNVHPHRRWGNGMPDQQLHNLYSMMWGKQMSLGYEEQTQRRSMIYSACGYAGVQKYVASWAGDTGGGPKPLASMLNLGLSGHSNHSCDMEVFSLEGIHFGFLQTWAQLNNWCYWRQPWYLTDDAKQVFVYYAQLRNRLLPYLYSSAHQAGATGLPVMRAMPLAFPEETDGAYDRTQYMLGDALLVSAYTDALKLPAGRWLNWWTHEREEGPVEKAATYPGNRGGCLYVREGGIVPMWPIQMHVEAGFHRQVSFVVFPGRAASSFTLYEDDGETLEYRAGRVATTLVECQPLSGGQVKIVVHGREGTFAGMNETRDVTFSVYLDKAPGRIVANGEARFGWTWKGGENVATVKLDGVSAVEPLVLEIL